MGRLSLLDVKAFGLATRVGAAIELYPCEILIIHRDAEREPAANRIQEIDAVKRERPGDEVIVCLVPVRMTEAWFLFDIAAIRRAAGNPNGRVALQLPPPGRVERLPDPKSLLRSLLEDASETIGRRRAKFDWFQARQRVAELIEDYEPLRRLPAFRSFEEEVATALKLLGENMNEAARQ